MHSSNRCRHCDEWVNESRGDTTTVAIGVARASPVDARHRLVHAVAAATTTVPTPIATARAARAGEPAMISGSRSHRSWSRARQATAPQRDGRARPESSGCLAWSNQSFSTLRPRRTRSRTVIARGGCTITIDGCPITGPSDGDPHPEVDVLGSGGAEALVEHPGCDDRVAPVRDVAPAVPAGHVGVRYVLVQDVDVAAVVERTLDAERFLVCIERGDDRGQPAGRRLGVVVGRARRSRPRAARMPAFRPAQTPGRSALITRSRGRPGACTATGRRRRSPR